MSALVYIVTLRIKLTVTHDIRQLSSYEFTNLLRCIVSTKFMPKLAIL